MSVNRRKDSREKDPTARYLAGDIDEDRVEKKHRFTARSKTRQQNKTLRTTLMRAAEQQADGNIEALPIGEVIQVHSLFSEVVHGGMVYLCVVRKTLNQVSRTAMVVGDRVRFHDTGIKDETGRPEAVIEQVLPRQTVITRTESFKGIEQQPIVANADQMLIVASLCYPQVKWGLIDRMIVAAKSGGLVPVVCLNKMDLADEAPPSDTEAPLAQEVLANYQLMGIATLQTSVVRGAGLDALRGLLKDRVTVLAGHSGVGKSSLIRAIQPQLDIRIGAVSEYTLKGRHVTTSARRYPLDFGGYVVDTPGVKHFGLWGVNNDNLIEYFTDIEAGNAPEWRKASYQRIAQSLL